MSRSPMNLTQDPIPDLVVRIAAPASIGLFFHTMYNVVDNWFAKDLSPESLSALGYSFPIFFVFIAVCNGFSIGVSAVVSNLIGRDDRSAANVVSRQAVSLSIVGGLLIGATVYFIAPSLFRLMNADGEYLRQAMEYMTPLCFGAVFLVLGNAVNGALIATGDTVTLRNILMGGCVLNVGFNWLFLRLGWGIAGLAWATVTIQILTTCYTFFRARAVGLQGGSLSQYRLNASVSGDILKQALPSMLNMLTIGLGIFVINRFASLYSNDAVGAYNVATRIEQLVLLPCLGLNSSTMSIVGQNVGAGNFARVRETIVVSLRYGAIIMGLGSVFLVFLGRPLVRIFETRAEIVDMSVGYLYATAATTLAYAVLFISISAMQGMKKPWFAIWIGLYRQLLMPWIVFTLITSVFAWQVNALWWGISCITWSAAGFTLWYVWKEVARLDP